MSKTTQGRAIFAALLIVQTAMIFAISYGYWKVAVACFIATQFCILGLWVVDRKESNQQHN